MSTNLTVLAPQGAERECVKTKGGDIGELKEIPVEYLHSGRYQPRKDFPEDALEEIADSIRENGILQPLVVREIGAGGTKYEIIAGERRWRGAQKAGLEVVPCLLRKADDQKAATLSLIENLQRADLNPIEEAEGYQRILMEFKGEITIQSLARTVGVVRTKISKLTRLLKLPDSIKTYIIQKKLSETSGQELLRLEKHEERKHAGEQAVVNNFTVRQIKALVDRLLHGKKNGNSTQKKTERRDAEWMRIEEHCSKHIGHPTTFIPNIKDKSGQAVELRIMFASADIMQEKLIALGLPDPEKENDFSS